MVVLPFFFSKVVIMLRSDSGSRLLVASSSNSTLGLPAKALASPAIRWSCPPLRLLVGKSFPISVEYPSGRLLIKSCTSASCAAFSIASCVISRPKAIFSAIVPFSTMVSWKTTATCSLYELSEVSEISWLSKYIYPESYRIERAKQCNSVVFPAPEGPKTEHREPALTKRWSMSRMGRGRPGHSFLTFFKTIAVDSGSSLVPFVLFSISSFSSSSNRSWISPAPPTMV
mmetsp:Transcript_20535/g.33917  ORF Transcript_20535/g.33917 Transcript_20535/m.33917 type:complete len:229 (-) Transcript_20535:645-1331(-)